MIDTPGCSISPWHTLSPDPSCGAGGCKGAPCAGREQYPRRLLPGTGRRGGAGVPGMLCQKYGRRLSQWTIYRLKKLSEEKFWTPGAIPRLKLRSPWPTARLPGARLPAAPPPVSLRLWSSVTVIKDATWARASQRPWKTLTPSSEIPSPAWMLLTSMPWIKP